MARFQRNGLAKQELLALLHSVYPVCMRYESQDEKQCLTLVYPTHFQRNNRHCYSKYVGRLYCRETHLSRFFVLSDPIWPSEAQSFVVNKGTDILHGFLEEGGEDLLNPHSDLGYALREYCNTVLDRIALEDVYTGSGFFADYIPTYEYLSFRDTIKGNIKPDLRATYTDIPNLAHYYSELLDKLFPPIEDIKNTEPYTHYFADRLSQTLIHYFDQKHGISGSSLGYTIKTPSTVIQYHFDYFDTGNVFPVSITVNEEPMDIDAWINAQQNNTYSEPEVSSFSPLFYKINYLNIVEHIHRSQSMRSECPIIWDLSVENGFYEVRHRHPSELEFSLSSRSNQLEFCVPTHHCVPDTVSESYQIAQSLIQELAQSYGVQPLITTLNTTIDGYRGRQPELVTFLDQAHEFYDLHYGYSLEKEDEYFRTVADMEAEANLVNWGSPNPDREGISHDF